MKTIKLEPNFSKFKLFDGIFYSNLFFLNSSSNWEFELNSAIFLMENSSTIWIPVTFI